jgi:hypothetical protein
MALNQSMTGASENEPNNENIINVAAGNISIVNTCAVMYESCIISVWQ